MIQAIETQYNGYRFRSRLEARWAVFFDAIHQEYRYELSGYDLGGVSYLPDFQLLFPPVVDGYGDLYQKIEYVEVKAGQPARHEWNKAVLLCYGIEKDVHILSGEIGPQPDGRIYTIEWIQSYLPQFLTGTRPGAVDRITAMPPYATCWSSWAQCEFCGRIQISRKWLSIPIEEQECNFCGHEGENILHFASDDLLAAFATARSARFEFGETPRVGSM